MTVARTLSDSPRNARSPLDIPGITTLAAAITLLTAALVETSHGWSATTMLVLFCAATLMLGAFAAGELRSPRPMLDPHLLTQPRFLASISGALFTGLAVVGLMSYTPALTQQSLHISVLGRIASFGDHIALTPIRADRPVGVRSSSPMTKRERRRQGRAC